MSKTFKKLSVVKVSTNFREVVKVVDEPLVPPKDDQVLVKNIYAGVNASDINITAGKYGFNDGKIPFDIGLEGMGVVESVGKSVTMVKVGQPVMFMGVNSFKEYVVNINTLQNICPFIQTLHCQRSSNTNELSLYLKSDEVIPVPSLKPEFLALMICGLTATIGLDQSGRIQKGEKVLITASAGGTGHIGVQWAKQKGCHVIGMTSSPEKANLLKELGCDRIINYKTENLDEVLSKQYPDGIDVIWETIGGQTYQTLFKHLAVKGRLVIVGGISGYKDNGFPDAHIPGLNTTLLMKNQSLVGFLLFGYKRLYSTYLPQLIQNVMTNKLRIVLDFGKDSKDGPFNGIDSMVRGVEHLHSGRNSGKVVIKIQNE